MKGDPAVTYAGYVADPQIFQGAAQMALVEPLGAGVPALPSAVAPENLRAGCRTGPSSRG